MQQMIKHLHGHIVLDSIRLIDLYALQILGDAALSNPFGYGIAVVDFGMPVLHPGPDGGSVGVCRYNLHVWILFLKKKSDSSECATGTDRGHKTCELMFGLFPDLWPGRLIMGHAVGHIVELIGPKTFWCLCGDASGDANVIVGIFIRLFRYGSDFSAHGAQAFDFFFWLGLCD